MTTPSKRTLLLASAVALIAMGSAGALFYANTAAQASTVELAAAAPQAMPVAATKVESAPLAIWKNFSGRLQAVDYAEIRPQVSGRIDDINFADGQIVAEGDVLYVIDPRPYQAAVDQARAEVNAARDRADLAQKELARAESLVKTDDIPKRVYDERVSTVHVTKADVNAALARLEQAQINLDHAFVKAPISGRISRAEITKGNLVEAGPNAPVLTSIVSDNGIYADFEVDEQTYLTHVRTIAGDNASENKIPVQLMASDGSVLVEGFVHSFDNRLDTSSGTIRARALFANEDGTLLPGMFATIRMGSPSAEKKIAISDRAIGTDQDRKFVYVIGDDGKTAYREVALGDSVSGKRIVLSGLTEGETIVSDGIIRVRPGMDVAPQFEKDLASIETSAGTDDNKTSASHK
ncbi:efflux RND transporter periplasmic adaptor subunit [Micavibrio aeruginosavorus]|uniref:Membrane-fusion protein n=1 Tax=Micavibrio aeruginosavorus EPB TaxID=349215 RepID=M4VHR3_9BACT|nr:efflux RND transporter periplasmic adaptor subunit [Micavibrio aeruginosavorus]AGH98748.1 Membrane-fusion protein [Micavibrio aeruginosavorus EPB]